MTRQLYRSLLRKKSQGKESSVYRHFFDYPCNLGAAVEPRRWNNGQRVFHLPPANRARSRRLIVYPRPACTIAFLCTRIQFRRGAQGNARRLFGKCAKYIIIESFVRSRNTRTLHIFPERNIPVFRPPRLRAIESRRWLRYG